MLKPLSKNVVLKQEEVSNKTASGIILTQTSEKKPSIGIVEAVGVDCNALIKPQSKVVYKQYAGTTIKLDDIEYIIVEEKDILAMID